MSYTAPMSTASRGTTCRRASNGRRSCSRARSCNTRRGSTACTRFLDRWIAAGRGDAPCLVGPAETLTYGELDERVNRIANVLVGKLGLVPGGRVLLRAANTPMWVAVFFAVLKAGGVVVATMPLLRAREIAYPLDKAKIGLALCDHRLAEELEKARPLAPGLAARRLLGRRRRRTASRR